MLRQCKEFYTSEGQESDMWHWAVMNKMVLTPLTSLIMFYLN